MSILNRPQDPRNHKLHYGSNPGCVVGHWPLKVSYYLGLLKSVLLLIVKCAFNIIMCWDMIYQKIFRNLVCNWWTIPKHMEEKATSPTNFCWTKSQLQGLSEVANFSDHVSYRNLQQKKKKQNKIWWRKDESDQYLIVCVCVHTQT